MITRGYLIFLIWFAIVLHSCNSNPNNNDSKDEVASADPTFEQLYYGPISGIYDTLSIVFYHRNCGEWGGNQEQLRITRDNQHKLYARLVVDTVNCKEIIEINETSVIDDSKRVVVFDSTKHLNKDEEELISRLLRNTTSSYFEGMSEDKGYYIKIQHSKSFLIEQWGIEDDSYIRTRQELFGKIKKD